MIIQQRIELLTVLLFIGLCFTGASSYETCPMGCTCNATSNHAKCTTLSGLIRYDRTNAFESLDLSNIGLRKITSHLDKFTNLEKIDLSGNRLSEVNKLPKGIRDLNLSYNRITSAKLAKIPKSVVNLNLSDNHITYVPHSIMTLKDLRHLELSGNPINCTCDTLAVRNWLKAQHVWMDRHVICMAPLKFKGRPWLQMKQAEVCEVTVATKKAGNFGSKYNWDEIENDNELMQRDEGGSGDYDYDPVVSHSNENDKDKIVSNEDYPYGDEDSKEPVEPNEEDYEDEPNMDPIMAEVKEEEMIPVSTTTTTTTTTEAPVASVATDDDEDYGDNGSGSGSGSGELKIPIVPAVFSTEETTSSTTTLLPIVSSSDATSEDVDDYDEYGSGDSSVSSIPVVHDVSSTSTTESDITFEPEATEPSETERPFVQETLPDLNIFDPSLGSTTEAPSSSETDSDYDEDVVVPRSGVGRKTSDEVPSQTEIITAVGEETSDKSNVMQAKTDDSKNTFILLGILGILLICLIVYVAIKDKSSKRNRRSKNDVESGPGRELKEMNKDLLGKEKGNGHHTGNNNHHATPEKSPLMTPTSDKPNGHSFPAISPNRIDDVDHPINASPMSTFKPIKETPDEHETPEDPEPNNNNNNNNNQLPPNGDLPEVHAQEKPISPKRYSPVYTPRTPKLGNNQHLSDPKYSPVYSPETGRVKVKATEMPRPKTPVLVTRTKSSAGDYITTAEEIH